MAHEARFLTREKAAELARFAELRAEPEAYRGHRLGGQGYLDPEILPLCDALNSLDGVLTIQSCCGHRQYAPEGRSEIVVFPGLLWLRLSEEASRRFELNVGHLVAQECIRQVRKLYHFEGQREPHEVFEVTFRGTEASELGHSGRVLMAFFSSRVTTRA